MEYRLNKYISASGYCSRREADRFIESGNVTINGRRATIGTRVMPGQKVKVNGNLIESEIKPVYIAFNKPVGITSTSNLRERNNIIDFIKHEQKIFPIGLLDVESQGLVLLTNDSNTANNILNAGENYEKVYVVTVNKPINEFFIENMTNGISLNGQKTRRSKMEIINPYTFKITLTNETSRQIQKMSEYLGYEVHKLECIQIMNITLDKLGQGNFRDLSVNELNSLFDILESRTKETLSKKRANNNSKASFNPNLRNNKTIFSGSKLKKDSSLTAKKETDEQVTIKTDSKTKKTINNNSNNNILKGPREGKSKVKSVKDKTRRWYQ